MDPGSSAADEPMEVPQKPPPAATSEGTPAVADEVPPIEVDLKEPADERVVADESMPSVTERPAIEDGTLIAPTNLTTPTSSTHVVNDVNGTSVESFSESAEPPEPIHFGGTEDCPTGAFLERVACCHCSAQCFEEQRVCLECGGPVKPGSLKSQNRRTALARGRGALIDQLASEDDGPRVFLAKVKLASKDVADRGIGLASFEGEIIRKAKLALSKAKKKGYASVLDRYDHDNVYACSLTAIGNTRRFARIMDLP